RRRDAQHLTDLDLVRIGEIVPASQGAHRLPVFTGNLRQGIAALHTVMAGSGGLLRTAASSEQRQERGYAQQTKLRTVAHSLTVEERVDRINVARKPIHCVEPCSKSRGAAEANTVY